MTMAMNDKEILTAEEVAALGLVVDEEGDVYDPQDANIYPEEVS